MSLLSDDEPTDDNSIHEIFLIDPEGNIEKKVLKEQQLKERGFAPPYHHECFVRDQANAIERVDPELLSYDTEELEEVGNGFIPRREWRGYLQADDLERLFATRSSSIIGDLDSRQVLIIIVLIVVGVAIAWVLGSGVVTDSGSEQAMLSVMSHV